MASTSFLRISLALALILQQGTSTPVSGYGTDSHLVARAPNVPWVRFGDACVGRRDWVLKAMANIPEVMEAALQAVDTETEMTNEFFSVPNDQQKARVKAVYSRVTSLNTANPAGAVTVYCDTRQYPNKFIADYCNTGQEDTWAFVLHYTVDDNTGKIVIDPSLWNSMFLCPTFFTAQHVFPQKPATVPEPRSTERFRRLPLSLWESSLSGIVAHEMFHLQFIIQGIFTTRLADTINGRPVLLMEQCPSAEDWAYGATGEYRENIFSLNADRATTNADTYMAYAIAAARKAWYDLKVTFVRNNEEWYTCAQKRADNATDGEACGGRSRTTHVEDVGINGTITGITVKNMTLLHEATNGTVATTLSFISALPSATAN